MSDVIEHADRESRGRCQDIVRRGRELLTFRQQAGEDVNNQAGIKSDADFDRERDRLKAKIGIRSGGSGSADPHMARVSAAIKDAQAVLDRTEGMASRAIDKRKSHLLAAMKWLEARRFGNAEEELAEAFLLGAKIAGVSEALRDGSIGRAINLLDEMTTTPEEAEALAQGV